MKAVILAGGLGTRLQPYTTFLPKPMLPLGEKPLFIHFNGTEIYAASEISGIVQNSNSKFSLESIRKIVPDLE